MWYLAAFFIGCFTGITIMCLLAFAKAENDSMEEEWQHLRDKLGSEGKETDQ